VGRQEQVVLDLICPRRAHNQEVGQIKHAGTLSDWKESTEVMWTTGSTGLVKERSMRLIIGCEANPLYPGKKNVILGLHLHIHSYFLPTRQQKFYQ
jgi:hypothetical protein